MPDPARHPLFTKSEPIDERLIARERLGKLRQGMAQADVGGLILIDPINLRYASATRNMQVWSMHNMVRYGLVLPDALIVFELGSSQHQGRGPFVDEVRPAWSYDYMIVGPRAEEMARNWARDLLDIYRQHGGQGRLAIDRADLLGSDALRAEGAVLIDGKMIPERARAIKSLEEVRAFKRSLEAVEAAMAVMRESVIPGMSENQALAILMKEAFARGAEYPETRLLTSGPRTNPWFQETGDRIIEKGDLLSFDTDIIGPGGWYDDLSRSWVVGEVSANDEQRKIYELSRRQVTHNSALLKPGLAFSDYADKSFQLPETYLAQRYADVAHGCGLGVDYPLIWYPEDADWGAYDGLFEANMIVCCESYVGAKGAREGVKLEQPVWITADGPVVLSEFPYEEEMG